MVRRLRRSALGLLAVLGALILTGLGVGCALSAPTWKGPVTADDGETAPVAALQAALAEKPAPFVVLGFGEGRDVPEVQP